MRRRCEWCSLPFLSSTVGRPAKYCKRSCRQRAYESRKRAYELGLTEYELVITKESFEQLRDKVWALSCAIQDVEADLVQDSSPEEVRKALDWMLDNARPLVALPLQDTED